MQSEGLEAFRKRKEHSSEIYSYEKEPEKLTASFEKKFRSHKKAWTFFTAQAPSYKKVIFHWIITAKQEKTRLSRLDKAISESEKQKRLL